MIANLLDDLEPMILSISAEFGRRHRLDGADAQDFAQELRIWVIENEETILGWLDPDQYSPDHGNRIVAKALRNECKDLGLEYKAQATGYERSDVYFYSKGELRALMPAVFDPEKWLQPPQSDGRSTKAPAEGNNWIATLADVSRAYETLNGEDRDLLAAFHREGWTNKMMAEAAEVTEQVMSYRHDRAIQRLQKALGGQRPDSVGGTTRDPWRGRKSVSSASMRAYEDRMYEG